LVVSAAIAAQTTDFPQRIADLHRDQLWLVPDQPGGEAEHLVPVNDQVVVAAHVVPMLERVHVLGAIDFNDEPRFLPERVKVAVLTGGVLAASSPVRLG